MDFEQCSIDKDYYLFINIYCQLIIRLNIELLSLTFSCFFHVCVYLCEYLIHFLSGFLSNHSNMSLLWLNTLSDLPCHVKYLSHVPHFLRWKVADLPLQ